MRVVILGKRDLSVGAWPRCSCSQGRRCHPVQPGSHRADTSIFGMKPPTATGHPTEDMVKLAQSRPDVRRRPLVICLRMDQDCHRCLRRPDRPVCPLRQQRRRLPRRSEIPWPESTPVGPDPYWGQPTAIEKLQLRTTTLEQPTNSGNFQITIFRYPFVLGPGNSTPMATSSSCRA